MELMIAAVVFSIVFGAATGVLVLSIRYQKYNIAHHRLISEVSYAVEYMARSLRMAQVNPGLVGDYCPNNGQSYKALASDIAFVNYSGKCQKFYMDSISNQLMVAGGDFCCEAFPLISDDFELLHIQFIVLGDDVGDSDGLQPRVTVFMTLREKKMKDKPIITIQTTISQRNLDLL